MIDDRMITISLTPEEYGLAILKGLEKIDGYQYSDTVYIKDLNVTRVTYKRNPL